MKEEFEQKLPFSGTLPPDESPSVKGPSAGDQAPFQGAESEPPKNDAPAGHERTKERETMARRFLLAGRIQRARASVGERGPSHRKCVERARLAAECAMTVLDPPSQWRAGSGGAPALELYRDATYWALLALVGTGELPDLAACWKAVDPELLVMAAGGEDAVETVRRALIERDMRSTYAGEEEAIERDARTVRDFVAALIVRAEQPYLLLEGLLLRRTFNLVALFAAVLALVFASAFGVHKALLGPNLADGKPWRTSSQYPGFNAQTQVCDGHLVNIFFHTQEEDSPWLEFDLQTPTTVKKIELSNREDYQERAIPLVVELSQDGTKWVQVARHNDVFNEWSQSIPRQKARFVRFRASRRTFLHLRGAVIR